MKKSKVVLGIFLLLQVGCLPATPYKPTQADADELLRVIHAVSHTTLAYRAALVQQMLAEANYFASRLQLPITKPIQMTDIQDGSIPDPWYCVIKDPIYPPFPATIFGLGIVNTNIPMESRIHALKFAVNGRIDTANFQFSFVQGRLLRVVRLDGPETEYYARRLNELIGKPSLIDTNGAYQLATQWLAAVDVDMTALNKLKWKVSQLHYLLRGATNTVTLPLYYVDFGSKHFHSTVDPYLKDFDEPLVSVEILGITKTLQDLLINDESLSKRPIMLITNALDLIRTPNPPVKHLERPPVVKTNSASPP